MQDEIRGYFEAEAAELTDRLTVGAQQLGDHFAPEEAEPIRAMLRAAHTLKGAAHVVGEKEIAALAHRFEDVLADYRKGEAPDARADLLRLCDAIALGLKGGAEAAEPPVEVSPAAAGDRERGAMTASAASTPSRTDPVNTDRAKADRVDFPRAGTALLLQGAMEASGLAHSMRAALERLDAVDDTGTVEFRRLRRRELRRDLHDDLDRLERRLDDLFTHATQLQLAPAEALLLEAGRVVRSTAAQLGLEARCVTHGSDARLFAPLVDGLRDAMLHLLRNALAHGVESPAERRHQGKPEIATITVSLERRDRTVVLTCADDGRGIALEAVREAAVKQGELRAEEAASASRDTLLQVLLRPGFSLSGAVNEVSGRGVGLDAVRAAAERLGGHVAIWSEEQVGTRFEVIVPEQQFAVRALEVVAGGARHLLPLARVAQTFQLQPHHTAQLQGMRTLLVEGETMPFLALEELLGASGSGAWTPGAISPLKGHTLGVVVRGAANARLVLGVSAIGSARDVLVEPLPPSAEAEPYVAGVTVAPDGTPELVLYPEAIVPSASSAAWRAEVRAEEPEPAALPLLVIDDSLTTRMLEQSILEAEGYEVDVATSAEQGLQMARAGVYALFLVDVEMPGMNGYEFVAAVNADATLRETPCIMVTSLDSAESRERGRLAGAYSYIVKGEFNQGVYLERIESAVRQGTRARQAGLQAELQEGGSR